MPGFPRALARTLEELALATVAPSAIRPLADIGGDLAQLYERFDEQFQSTSAVDRAAFLKTATEAAGDSAGPYARARLLLLDVPVTNATERDLVAAMASRAPDAFATIPVGDSRTRTALLPLASPDSVTDLDADDEGKAGLARIRRYLFSETVPPRNEPAPEVELFSAPGEGRESVEIARRVLREARRGLPFDRMAIALRAPQHYGGLLEHALERAGVPVYFERGTRRPHPAGRAFLSLVACALDNLSARRFAEYLSLGQVPDPDAAPPADAFPTSSDEVFGALADRAATDAVAAESDDAERNAVEPRAFRSPWKWERLLAESRVVATGDRWSRRLNGLVHETELQRRELARTEPGSARLDYLTRKIDDVRQLAAFALPIIRLMAAWPVQASWAEWLDHFAALAPRVLRRPDRVLRVLADLRPMGAIGPVTLHEAARVLADRLASIEAEPPARRYGRVLVASPAQLRGRSFEVVFVPALAERMFPQKPREDPLLLDEARTQLDAALTTQTERAELEKLQPAARRRRCRIAALRVVPDRGSWRRAAAGAVALRARSLARDDRAGAQRATSCSRPPRTPRRRRWRGRRPADRSEAIDALEHDLATLRAAGRPAGSTGARPRALHPAAERLPAALRSRALHARQESLVALGRHHLGKRGHTRPCWRAASWRAPLLAVGAAEVCGVPVSVPADRDLSESGRPRISSRCSGWIR